MNILKDTPVKKEQERGKTVLSSGIKYVHHHAQTWVY